jgi:hypothetical protein
MSLVTAMSNDMKSGYGLTMGGRTLRLLLPLFALSALDCSGSDDSGELTSGTSCERLDAKLRDCTLFSEEGYTGCLEPQTDGERCQNDCMTEASCENLTTALCDPTQEAATSPLAQCLKTCDAPNAFACTDGQLVPQDFVCDGETDCAGGEDEMGCDILCPNGDSVPRAYHCDGFNDCSDGADELNCPMPFACANGETVSLDLRCDGVMACSDGSDEQGCAKSLCPSGTASLPLRSLMRLQNIAP